LNQANSNKAVCKLQIMKAKFIRTKGNKEIFLITGNGIREFQEWNTGYTESQIEEFLNN